MTRHLGLISLITLCFSTVQAAPQPSSPKPNIILIVADDFGYADLGSYGSTFYNTPNLNQLASNGVRFTDAYASSSVCSPSRASMLTGKYPARYEVDDWIPGRGSKPDLTRFMKLRPPKVADQIPLEETTLAEVLKLQGYRTAFVGKWHLGIKEEYWPENQGFDVNKGGWRAGAPYYRPYDSDKDLWHGADSGFFSPYRNPRLKDGPKGEYLTDRLTNESIRFIKDTNKQPFFLMLSYYTVHNPLHGKPELIEKNKVRAKALGLDKMQTIVDDLPWMNRPDPGLWRERLIQSNAEYAAMIESMDHNIGRILDTADTMGLDKNTIVVFTSDNGGLSTSEGSPTSNLPLAKGKGWLNEGGIRVPLIFSYPGKILSGAVVEDPVMNTDFFLTLLSFTSQAHNYDTSVDGVDLSPLLLGRAHAMEERSLYWHYPHYSNQGGLPSGAIRRGSYKLIEYFETGDVELFKLDEDISETHNLAAELPKIANKLKEDLKNWRKSVGAAMPTPNPNYDPTPSKESIDLLNDPT